MKQEKAPSHHGVETSGWVVTRSSDVTGLDTVKFGFTLQDHRLYPDTMEEIARRLGPTFEVADVTMPGTTSLNGLPARVVEIKRLIIVPSACSQANAQALPQVATTAPGPVPLEVVAALQRFAERKGRRWKSALLTLWETGRDDQESDGPLLRQMRNNFGPSFLMKMRLPVPIAG